MHSVWSLLPLGQPEITLKEEAKRKPERKRRKRLRTRDGRCGVRAVETLQAERLQEAKARHLRDQPGSPVVTSAPVGP